jgi:hypothetical protein
VAATGWSAPASLLAAARGLLDAWIAGASLGEAVAAVTRAPPSAEGGPAPPAGLALFGLPHLKLL